MSDIQSTTGYAAAATAAVTSLLLVLTAGCASTSAVGGATHTTSSPRPASPADQRSASASGYHTTATALARQITGCDPHPLSADAAARRLHLPGAQGVASAVTCTLRGRTAVVLTFVRRTEQAAVVAELRDRVAYYATGPGWSAAPTDTSEPVGQQSVVQDVAIALGGLVETGGA